MLFPEAREATGLGRERYWFILANYAALKEAAQTAPSKRKGGAK